MVEYQAPDYRGEALVKSLTSVVDALSLIKAIQTGNPLPVTVSALRLGSDFNPTDTNLAGTAAVGSGILSLLSLDNALKQGDTMAAVTAGAQTLGFAASAYTAFAEKSTAIGDFLNGTRNAQGEMIGGTLPYFNIVNSLVHGDAEGAAIGVIALAVPALGQAYAIYSIVKSLFDDNSIPDPWGSGRYVWEGSSIGISAAGETGGQEAVSGFLTQMLATMNTLVTQVQDQNPGSALGLIANRMPTLSYDMSGFRFTNIDPLTGVEKNPELRFDTSGRPYNAIPGSNESFQSLGEAFIRNALARGAIAPQWEVETAALQTQAGDPQAGLTEEERAARTGGLAAPQSGDTQTWRPVVLDLNDDGIQTVSQASSGVAFDVDDSGFLKSTGWVNNQDAFLVLDRNYNGGVDSARELLSNGQVGLDRRGVAGLAWMDGNYDGKLDAADPVFNQLKVWQDQNGNGAVDTGEETSLAERGITALNYSMKTFEQNGETKQLDSPDLEADTAGARINIIPEGILIQNTDNQTSLLVIRVDDLTQVQPNQDGVTGIEDIELIVSPDSLLANDTFGGFLGRDLTLTAVLNFRHGTGFVDDNHFVHFQPEANYSGSDAGFDYALQAPNGQTGTATVAVTVESVNDAPTLTDVQQDSRAIYGYTPVEQMGSIYLGGGQPIYQPYAISNWNWGDDGGASTTIIYNPPSGVWYYEYHTTPIAYKDTGEGQIHGDDVDDPASSLSYEVSNQPQYGSVSVNADGTFQYTGWKEPGVSSDDIVVDGQYAGVKDGRLYTQSNLPDQAVYPTSDVFEVKITDPHGASTIESVTVPHYGPYLPPTPPGGGGGKKPIALDLDRNGFSFSNVDDSNVFFDINNDGWKRKVSWLAPGDGLLAYDADGNGKIERGSEIAFARYSPGAQSDLEGLRAFDSNHDGLLSAADEKWSKFGVWQDADSDGVTDPGEFKSLDELGVASVSLASDEQFSVIDGTTVQGVAKVSMTDGSTLDAADFILRFSNDVLVNNPDGTSQVVTRQPFSPSGEVLSGTDDNDLILGKSGNTVIQSGSGNDVVFAGDGNDLIDPGSGDDVIYAAGGNDIVMPGTGNDVVYGGLGDDLIFGGDGNNALLGEGGNDVVLSGEGNDLIDGGAGNDVVYGGGGDDLVSGGSGNDALFGADGADELLGGSGHDLLYGGNGDDLLDGGTGADEMIGGAGNDTYVVDDAGDNVVENPNEGTDTVRASIAHTLGAGVENLTLTGTDNLTGSGNELDNIITGNSGDNTLIGGAGNDRLDGGAGADTLIGGAGDDTYIVNGAGDVIIENAGEGTDTVRASVSYTLSDNVENLTLTGTADLDATGNALGNTITGNGGDNVLDGGAGADSLVGGAGNDTYIVDQAGDAVIEDPNAGTDTVLAAASYALSANIENLVLTGAANISGAGNTLDNAITGNSGNNTLDGGVGADTLIGGQGDDTYIVDDTADVVVENLNEGDDTVASSVSYTLAANLENLIVTGNADLAGTGNELDNQLTGNSGSNALDGGAGADTMRGGAGDDTYVVDNAGDVVTENPGEGVDTVLAGVSHALAANVENLTLTGPGDLSAIGNDLSNVLTGNSGNNLLDGGSGADAMFGGAGNDAYVADSAGDAVVESQNAGTDAVLASVSYALSENVENLSLTGVGDIDAAGNALNNVLLGNSGNNILDGGVGADTMAGGAGNDVYVVDDMGDAVVENPGAGRDTVRTSIDYGLGADVENLTLTGTADLTGSGNELDNVIAGNSGNNLLDGGVGADTLIGGAGDDTYVVDNAGDLVVENPAEGTDTVLGSVSYSLSANVENLTLTGSGNIDGTGNDLNNLIVGNSGANVLDGGAGADTLIGGAGDDNYIVDNAGDVAVEGAGEGTDTILASVSYVLPADVENLTLTGSSDIDATGNELNNVLSGNSGDNVLDGTVGADTMLGGAGDDTYVVDDPGDAVVENPGEGNDTVFASISYVLPDNVENLTLTGAADLSGTGNVLDNAIVGNGGNNLLDGGAGADTMIGGQGDETYVVENAGDVVIERANEGNDTVLASVSYALSDNVENLTLTGTSDIDGTGNTLSNVLTGNSGGNVLDGGAGADTMLGGAGDDTYVIDNAGDVVIENPGEGIDTILASVSYVLPANVENLTLTGTADIDGTGNGLDNVLTGNSGNNVLAGAGGNDTFAGGRGDDLLMADAGDDTYIYNTGDGLDSIADAGGNNAVCFGAGLSLANVAIRLDRYTSKPDGSVTTTAHLRVLDGNGDEQPDQGMDFTVTVDRKGNVVSPIQSFQFADGSIHTFGDLLITTQTTHAGSVSGPVVTGRNDDIIYAGPNNTGIWSGTGNDIVYAVVPGTSAYGEGGKDYLAGFASDDTLDGGWGIDLVGGAGGNDVLSDPGGNSALLGGTGNDRITAGAGNDFIAGGKGSDAIVTGAMSNVVAFNSGDGQDTIQATPGAENTLSLGGGIGYSDLAFKKSGDDLILNIGKTDSITLQGWYGSASNHDFVTLQVIEEAARDYSALSSDPLRNKKIEEFDFGSLVAQFDQALAANPSLTSWSLMNGLLAAHLGGSDTAAAGGDLAYQYGLRGDLSRMDLAAVQTALEDPQFGKAPQTVVSLGN
ncbi:MAG: hypothetical protein A2140_02755 [Candidatus Muproteobacteria bacterium RBG_16_62_13]|uniref:Uncharacterized protein n=1 Tax=Candidatus Muproteobacteria bacterium RBG_16_62_13 TaxID=1817756 RepID=A0A1F6T840_9PROT|nr:MAG: hypothetical protein A2140_02755 [Candidatus Muproteobacteria bacterium RBG_16_62_13]